MYSICINLLRLSYAMETNDSQSSTAYNIQGYLFVFMSSACQLCSAPNLYSKSNTEEAASVWDGQVSWQREKRDGRTSQGLSELLRNDTTGIHISTAKASHSQANAKYNPPVRTGQINHTI